MKHTRRRFAACCDERGFARGRAESPRGGTRGDWMGRRETGESGDDSYSLVVGFIRFLHLAVRVDYGKEVFAAEEGG
jgi:hypothetical protein